MESFCEPELTGKNNISDYIVFLLGLDMQNDAKLEAAAKNLFNCPKDMRSYLIESGGSIGPSKLSEQKKKK